MVLLPGNWAFGGILDDYVFGFTQHLRYLCKAVMPMIESVLLTSTGTLKPTNQPKGALAGSLWFPFGIRTCGNAFGCSGPHYSLRDPYGPKGSLRE